MKTNAVSKVPADYFTQIYTKIKNDCKLVHSILSSIVINEDFINDAKIKKESALMKQACHLFGLMLHIRNQCGINDAPFLFGLACMSYGSGEKQINMFHNSGLMEHYETMKNHLSQRL